jgi:hypothetical protein
VKVYLNLARDQSSEGIRVGSSKMNYIKSEVYLNERDQGLEISKSLYVSS